MQHNKSFIWTLLTVLGISVASARDLVDIIPGLYGGDGIQVDTVSGAGFPSHREQFVLSSQSMLSKLNRLIASEFQPIPVAASAGGPTFKFNPTTGSYSETSTTLGPILAERPQTLGKGKFSTSFAFSYYQYDTLEGRDLSKLTQFAPHRSNTLGDPIIRESFENDSIQIVSDTDIDIASILFSGAYGVTDKLDLGISVPLVRVSMDITANATVISSPQNPFSRIDPATGRRFTPFHQLGGTGDSPTDSASDSAVGFGDILLSAKYYALDAEQFDLAGALQVKLQNGDQDNFLGTGSTTIRPFLISSADLGEWVRIHLNLGYRFDLGDRKRDNLNYTAGFEVGNQTLTGIFDFVGRNELGGDGVGDEIYDAAIGVKWRAVDNLIVAGNVLVPLNRKGLRSDIIGLISLEYRNWKP